MKEGKLNDIKKKLIANITEYMYVITSLGWRYLIYSIQTQGLAIAKLLSSLLEVLLIDLCNAMHYNISI